MIKKLFIPFTIKDAGDLSGHLKFSEPIQKGYSQAKVAQGRYRGFKREDYVHAPHKKSDGQYEETQQLTQLMGEEDQLYILGHCLKGLAYLSNTVQCDGKVQVKIPDLVNQLKAHRLSTETQVKIKLWACQAALGDETGAERKSSFAASFSKQMYDAEYKHCRIFAYTEYLMTQYETKLDDGDTESGFHKRISPGETEQDRVRRASKSPQVAYAWSQQLRRQNNDENRAVAAILSDPIQRLIFFKHAPLLATTGPRAKQFRMEFKDGLMIGQ